MPFDVRSMSSGPLHRPVSQYYTSAPLATAPMASMMATPAYQAPVSYGGYSSYTPTPALDTHFKQEPEHHQYSEKSHLRLVSAEPEYESEHARSVQDPRNIRLCGSRSPSVKSEAQTYASSSSHSRRGSRSVASFSVTGSSQIDFNTSVDTLMKAIQAKPDSDATSGNTELGSTSPEADIKTEHVGRRSMMGTQNRIADRCRTSGCTRP